MKNADCTCGDILFTVIIVYIQSCIKFNSIVFSFTLSFKHHLAILADKTNLNLKGSTLTYVFNFMPCNYKAMWVIFTKSWVRLSRGQHIELSE